MALEPSNVRLPFDEGATQQQEQDKALVGEVNDKYIRWRGERLAHEVTWFFNAAFVRGVQWISWSNALRQIEAGTTPSYRIRVTANKVLSFYRARRAKFLKARFEPEVIPFSQERSDKLDARATRKAFEYTHQREQLEQKYRRALNWANIASKGFWWFYWDPTKIAYVSVPDATGKMQTQEAQLGDVCVEAGGPFEVLPSDPGADSVGECAELMRIKLRLVSDVKARHKEKADQIKGDTSSKEAFTYQRQIATLAAKGSVGTTYSDPQSGEDDTMPYIMVKELFTKPCGKYPKGRHVIVAGEILLHSVDELPYSFHNLPNPYPCVEFPDLEMTGQFWPTTMVEQTIGIQKEYNLLRSAVAEQVRMMKHPKIIVPVQCQWPEGAWKGGQPGEVIRIVLPPGAQGPQVIAPANIASDVWRTLELIQQEFHDITSIHPVSQGNVGDTTSGFQVNLLQEASDSVHAPDIRLHELAFEEAYYKLRRMMKLGYTVPRLISILGRNSTPEVFEFSRKNIDEHAEVRVRAGSGLSTSPAIKNKQIMEMFPQGIMGDPASNATRRRALKHLDVGGIADLQEEDRIDEELARRENEKLRAGMRWNDPSVIPMPWHDHEVHWEEHTAETKLPEFEDWTPEAKVELYKHLIWHAQYQNVSQAWNLATQFGFQDMVQILQPMVDAQAQQTPATGPEQAPAAAPPQASSAQSAPQAA